MFNFIKDITLPQLYAWLAPWTTPIPSALFLAYHVSIQADNPTIGFWAGVGSFLGFEAAGGICATGMVLLHTRKKYELDFWICLSGLILYCISPWIILNFLASLAVPIYAVLTGFSVFAANVWVQTIKEDKRIEEATKLELKKLRAATKLQKLQNATGGVQKVYECEYCQAKFDSPQAYGVHKGRYCKSKPQ